MVYQYTIKAPKDIKSVQITGTFDNWSKSLPEITTEPFEQTITIGSKEDIIFKFIIDGNWTTLDLYDTITDHEGNLNNIIKSDDLILVEEEEEPTENNDDEFVDNQTFTTTDNEDVLSAPVVINDGEESKEPTKSPDLKHQQKQTPPIQTTTNQTSSAVSSFAAVSSPPSSSDYEHIDSKISNEESTTNNNNNTNLKDTSKIKKDEPKPIPKPDKPTLQSQPSDSTLGLNNASNQSNNNTSSSNATTGYNKSTSTTEQTNHKIPGSFDQSKSNERPTTERQESGLISKLKRLFR
ncbi:hypothetical protein KGF54_001156 [Candida jiufengensis]|uniref:uncharacterized protein n=1 Tax=Candida jiufengensis TaxID=497108 RepID=UPI0022242791|nr:uncharacterized protein KGF54_001156 [Candida jiufengensis]KAI5955654.1 hypothetical protein KGF54_001156 [Candida jiufengensis]